MKILQVFASPRLCHTICTMSKHFSSNSTRILPVPGTPVAKQLTFFSEKHIVHLPLGHDALGQLPMGGSILATLGRGVLAAKALGPSGPIQGPYAQFELQHCFLVFVDLCVFLRCFTTFSWKVKWTACICWKVVVGFVWSFRPANFNLLCLQSHHVTP